MSEEVADPLLLLDQPLIPALQVLNLPVPAGQLEGHLLLGFSLLPLPLAL